MPGLVCPECGSDLREVGIRVGRAGGGGVPRWFRLTVGLLLWTAVSGAAAGLLGPLTVGWLPHWATGGRSATLGEPASGAYPRVTVTSSGTQRADAVGSARPATGRATAVLAAADGKESTLAVDLATGRYTWDLPGGMAGGGGDEFGAAAVRAWLAAVGIDAARPEVAAEAAEIADVARQPFRDYHKYAGGVSGSSSSSGGPGPFRAVREQYAWRSEPSRLGVSTLALLGFVTWAGGLWWIWRRRPPRPAQLPSG